MRRKQRFLWIIPTLAILFTSAAMPFSAKAAGTSAVTSTAAASGETVSVPLFTSPQSMKLPHNTASFWFVIPSGTQLGGNCSMTLQMKAAETLLSDYSSVTLIVNDVQVSSVHLAEVVRNGAGSWTVTIPVARLKTDGTLNELRIVTAQRSILGDCADIDNPSNWVTLEESSVLSLSVLEMGAPELGMVLPYYFNRIDQMDSSNAEFVLPSTEDVNARSAMLTIASAIGAAYPSKSGVNFTVSQGSPAGTEQNRILLGLGSQKPSGIDSVPELKEGNGFLSVSRNGGRNNLFVYGLDAAGLEKAAAFFTNAKYLSQLSGSSAVITTDLRGKTVAAAKKDDGYYTLSDFGYSTVNLAGAFHQQVTYTLKQPKDVRSGGNSYVEIHFRHSAALLGDTSLLTVYFNDVAATSIQLSDSNAEGGTIKAKIPADALNNSLLNLKIDCYNYLGKIDCSKDYYDTAWTVIDGNSVVFFEPGTTTLAPTVKQLPMFDTPASGGTGRALLLAPKNASTALLATAAELACRAGQNSGTAFRWEAADDLTASAAKDSSDILILGGSGLTIPNEVAKLLDAVPNSDGSFTVASAAGVTAEALRNKIVVQAVRSPWNYSHRVFVITCPSGMENQLKQFVSQRKGLDKLNGTMALIDAAGNVTTVDNTAVRPEEKVPFSFDRTVSWLVRTTGISRVGLTVILVCIVLVILLIIKVMSNRRRFVHAKAKVEQSNAKSASALPKPPQPASGKSSEKQNSSPEPDNFEEDD